MWSGTQFEEHRDQVQLFDSSSNDLTFWGKFLYRGTDEDAQPLIGCADFYRFMRFS
jgi:hypothetical protein